MRSTVISLRFQFFLMGVSALLLPALSLQAQSFYSLTNSPTTFNFTYTPGTNGTAYPTGWTSYNHTGGTTVEDNVMTVGNSSSTIPGNYNYNSRIGLLGGVDGYNPSSLVLAIESVFNKLNLQLDFDVDKVSEESGSSVSLRLEVSTTSPTSGFVAISGGEYTSGTLATGNVKAYNNIDLSAFSNVSGPLYLRWYYSYVSGTSTVYDGIAIDDVELTWSNPAITTGAASPSSYCTSPSDVTTVSVPFTSTGIYAADNVYNLEMSYGDGAWTDPVVIGSLQTNANGGTINGIIPTNKSELNGFRMRVVATNPRVVGSNNSNGNLSINYKVEINDGLPDVVNVLEGGHFQYNILDVTNPNTYRWQSSSGSGWNNFAGTTSAAQSDIITPSDNGLQVRVIALGGGACKNDTSNISMVNVLPLTNSLWYNNITASSTGGNPYTSGQVVTPNIKVSGIGRTANSFVEQANMFRAQYFGSALDLTKYFTFTLTPDNGYMIDFSSFRYNTYRYSTQSPNQIVVRSSLDNYSTNIPIVADGHVDLSDYKYQNITSPITFRIYPYGSTGNTNLAIQDFVFYGTASIAPDCTAPSILASNINFTHTSNRQVTANYTAGNGAGRIVVINSENKFTLPATGYNPTATTVYNGGEQVVYNGTGSNPITISNLNPSQTYWVKVFEYCDFSRVYNTFSATDNPNSFTTLPEIATGTISPAGFCISANQAAELSVPFTNSAPVSAGHIYTAQLSSASGSFANPVTIGTLQSTAQVGTVQAIIPATTAGGNGYRIRVVSNQFNPVLIDNGSNLTGNKAPAIATQPKSVTALAGSLNRLLVSGVTNGSGYEWQVNTGTGFTTISDSTTNHYTTAAAAMEMNNYQYRVLVNGLGACQAISSDVVTLTVVPTDDGIWYNPINGIAEMPNGFTGGQYVANNLKVSGISRSWATYSGNVVSNHSFTSVGWYTSGGFNSNKYFYFTLTPINGHKINFSQFAFQGHLPHNGSPTHFSVRSSLDNYVAELANTASATIDLTDPAFQNVNGPVTFRIYAWGAGWTDQQYAINDFIFRGSVVPDPNAAKLYRTRANGNYGDPEVWEAGFDNSPFEPAVSMPGLSNNILVRHHIVQDVDVELEAGAQFTVDNTADASFTINPGHSFTVRGNAHFNGRSITLRSDATGTATIGAVTGSLDGATNVTIERNIGGTAGRRAWRLITAPLTGTNNNTLFDTWQNRRQYQAGRGTHITGPLTPTDANGLDNNSFDYSAKQFIGGVLTGVANTKTAQLFNQNGPNPYFIFVRGDRDASNLVVPNYSATTLSATGALHIGRKQVVTNTGNNSYSLISNPYPATVDLAQLNLYNRGNNLRSTYYYWDPNASGVGAYVTVQFDQSNQPTFAGAGTPTTYIQSGQAFFVQNKTNTTPGADTLVFLESFKGGAQSGVPTLFRTGSNKQQLLVGLYLMGDANPLKADGILASFNKDHSAGINNEDAYKLNNVEENISFVRNGVGLSIEGRPLISQADTLFVHMSNIKTNRNYQFIIEPSDIEMPGVTAFLVDGFQKTSQPISLSETTTVGFATTADVLSRAGNRFLIVMKPNAVLPVRFTSINAHQKGADIQVEWGVAAEQGTRLYEIHKSADGRNFVHLASITATGAAAYQWLDGAPAKGNHFYRIKAVDANGSTWISSAVKVVVGGGVAGVSVYPNPVTGSTLQLQFANVEKGTYIIKLTNTSGQLVYNTGIRHIGGSFSQSLPIGTLPAGVYKLTAIGRQQQYQQKIIIQ